MEGNIEVKKEIRNILDKYSEYYQNKDLDGLMSLFVPDPDLVAIGTGADEWIYGHDQLKAAFKRDLSQGNEIHLVFDNLTISVAGKVAWVSGVMTMDAMVDGEEIILTGRVTMVLEEKDKGWLFTHSHYSVPAKKQNKGESWP